MKKSVPCELSPEARSRIDAYTRALEKAAFGIGNHGLSEKEFWESRLFSSAVEKIRGRRSATTLPKKEFIESVLTRLQASKKISNFAFTGSNDRHDFTLEFPDGRVCVIEAKGCLDGNNTIVFTRPDGAREFVIWSLCQNPGADPRKNVWSGIHTRLGGRIIADGVHVDALIVWDPLCGTPKRPCPKLESGRLTNFGDRSVPPPCVYLFPSTPPNPRGNKNPPVLRLDEVRIAKVLLEEFGGDESDVIEVHIEAQMKGDNTERRTILKNMGEEIERSRWTRLKQATRR